MQYLLEEYLQMKSFITCSSSSSSSSSSSPIWRVAVNKFNKQPRTADEGWSSSFGVGRGANNPSP